LRDAIVNDGFSEYLLNRVEMAHAFSPPQDRETLKDILRLSLRTSVEEIEKHDKTKINIGNEEAFLEELTSKYFPPEEGFREALSNIQRAVLLAAATSALSQPKANPCELSLISSRHASGSDDGVGVGFTKRPR
jgi:ATP-dependent Clp protease ATP-binding subunit ClpA